MCFRFRPIIRMGNYITKSVDVHIGQRFTDKAFKRDTLVAMIACQRSLWYGSINIIDFYQIIITTYNSLSQTLIT